VSINVVENQRCCSRHLKCSFANFLVKLLAGLSAIDTISDCRFAILDGLALEQEEIF
jgi:hypothetical protein